MDDLLTTDHHKLDEMLDQLFSSIDMGNAKKVFEKLDIFWARLAMHIRAEHLHLFPAILNAAKTSKNLSLETVQIAIEKLHTDHDFFMRELATAIKLLRQIIQSEDDKISKELSIVHEKVLAISHKLKEHNELEESKVYCWVETLLDSQEYKILNEKMQKELSNLPLRFR